MLLYPDGTYKLLVRSVGPGPAFIKRIKGDTALVEQANRLWLIDLTTLSSTPADENGNPTN